MRKTLSVAAMILVSVCLLWPGIAGAETRTFEDPTFGRAALDFCRFNQDGCGIEAALYFCRREGYVDAQSYRGPVSVERTMRVGNRTTCRDRRCEGFSQITCERPDPVEEEEEERPPSLQEQSMNELMDVEVTRGPFVSSEESQEETLSPVVVEMPDEDPWTVENSNSEE